MLGAVPMPVMSLFLQDIFVISHSPSGMETGKSKSEERSQLLTDPVVTGIAYEINKANKKLNQHRLQVCIYAFCTRYSGMLLRSVGCFTSVQTPAISPRYTCIQRASAFSILPVHDVDSMTAPSMRSHVALFQPA